VRQANLTRGAEYKAELEEMKEMAAQQREEWMHQQWPMRQLCSRATT